MPRPTSTSRSDSFVSSLRSSRNDGPLYSLLLFPSLSPSPFPPHPPLLLFPSLFPSPFPLILPSPPSMVIVGAGSTKPHVTLDQFVGFLSFFSLSFFSPFLYIYEKARMPWADVRFFLSCQWPVMRSCLYACMYVCMRVYSRSRTHDKRPEEEEKKKRRLKLYFFSSPKFAISTCVRVFFFRISGHLVFCEESVSYVELQNGYLNKE